MGRPRGTFLILELALYGYQDDMSTVRGLAVRAIAYPWAVLRYARNRLRRGSPARDVTIGPAVTALLDAATEVADGARHRVIDPEHVLVAALAAAGVASWLARLVSGWDARQSEVVKELIAETQDGFQDFGLPRVYGLSPAAVSGVYAAFGARRPAPGDSEPLLLSDLP
jgi:hypothetical protein